MIRQLRALAALGVCSSKAVTQAPVEHNRRWALGDTLADLRFDRVRRLGLARTQVINPDGGIDQDHWGSSRRRWIGAIFLAVAIVDLPA